MQQILIANTIKVSKNASQLRSALKIHQLQQQFSEKKLGNSIHFRSVDLGIEIQYSNDCLDTIFIYYRTPKIKQYKESLPPPFQHIVSSSTVRSIVMYYGESLKKSKTTMEIIFQQLGMGVVFCGKNGWGNEDTLIQYLYFFRADNKDRCYGCGKTSNCIFLCETCNLAKYCCQQCKKKHFGFHKIFCQEVD